MAQHIGGGRALATLVAGLSLVSSAASGQPTPAAGLLLHSPTSSALELLIPDAGASAPAARHASAIVFVDDQLRPIIDDLLARSPAFRRQWQRPLREPRLSITLELVHANQIVDAHAATKVSAHPDGSLHAVVAIPGGRRLAELIAHEVEHVLERLDGVRVATRHAMGDPTVRRASGTFETARAVLVGQLVAAEIARR